MKTMTPESTRLATPTLQYTRLLARRAQARMRPRPDAPVGVLARLLALGAGISRMRDAVVLSFAPGAWQRLAPARQRTVLKEMARYRNVYAVIGSRCETHRPVRPPSSPAGDPPGAARGPQDPLAS